MIIAEPKIIFKPDAIDEPITYSNHQNHFRFYAGFYLEIKTEAARKRTILQSGKLAKNEHVQKQAKWHQVLRERGYKADFYFGLDECIAAIEEYLALPGYFVSFQ